MKRPSSPRFFASLCGREVPIRGSQPHPAESSGTEQSNRSRSNDGTWAPGQAGRPAGRERRAGKTTSTPFPSRMQRGTRMQAGSHLALLIGQGRESERVNPGSPPLPSFLVPALESSTVNCKHMSRLLPALGCQRHGNFSSGLQHRAGLLHFLLIEMHSPVSLPPKRWASSRFPPFGGSMRDIHIPKLSVYLGMLQCVLDNDGSSVP